MKNYLIAHLASLIFLCLLFHNSMNAQCNNSTYSTNEKDSWLSCQTSPNPNASRGTNHWLQYDLGYIYEVGASHFWNYNVTNLTDRGFKQIAIDYSLDGTTWTESDTFQLPEADGITSYEGNTGLDLSGITARYILITALSNWGGGTCAGLSEVRFQVSAPSNTCGDFIVTENIGGNSIDAGTYYSNNKIESNGTVDDGMAVTFKAATEIHLKNGFIAKAGSQFIAQIESCNILNQPATSQARNTVPIIENKVLDLDIKIYPNPTVNVLNISLGEVVITDLVIINVSGHELLRRTQGQNLRQLDVSSLSSGMYLVQLLTKQRAIITRRFIKAGL